jgi:omega-amidase
VQNLTPRPCVAIAQIPMHWEMRDNVNAMKRALRVAKQEGATHCAFSELAVTGFHRRIVDWAKPEVSAPAVDELRALVAKLGIATTFGAPTYGPGGVRFNSHLFVAPNGSLLGIVSKIGLTEPEATFFAPGAERPVVDLAGIKCTAVICREIEDVSQVLPQLRNTGVEVIFWPGQMRPDPDKPAQEPPEHVVRAQDLAREAGAYVIQTNWPNALNRPEESEETGHSACIGPTGELLFRLPKHRFGIGVFTLGESDFRWHPSEA